MEALPGVIEARHARALLWEAFTTARMAGRDSVFESLQLGAPLLASLDGGETLWPVYRGVIEVETWWSVERGGSSST
jgi:hypothetical protein